MSGSVRVLAHDSAVPGLSRRALLGGFALAGVSAALAGCGTSREFAASAAPDGEFEEQLNVYSWGDYDDPANIAKFQKKLGVTVQLDSFASNEEMIAKLGAARGTSGYDVVVPTGNFVPMMSQNGLLQKLDHSLIPNISNIEEIYRTQSWDPDSTWAVCKNWGTTGFAYDTTKLDGLTSWADFLGAVRGEASGSAAMLGDPWEVTSAYFFANGIDPNTSDPHDLDECEAFMVDKIAPHLRAFTSNASTNIIQNDFALVQVWNGDARLGLTESDDPERWRFVFPDEGANLWMDTWAIASGAQHPDSAHEFINFMLSPGVGIREVDYNGYPTGLVGQAVLAQEMELEMIDLIFPDPQILQRLVAAEITESQERLVQIWGRMQARAGA